MISILVFVFWLCLCSVQITFGLISVIIGLNSDETNNVAELYWQAFGEKLNSFLGPKQKGEAYISKILNNKFSTLCCIGSGHHLWMYFNHFCHGMEC